MKTPWLLLLVTVCLMSLIGCRAKEPIDEYGSATNRNSISGLTVLRSNLDRAGFRTYRLRSLSDRSLHLDSILWAPTDFGSPSELTIRWFEDWLKTNDQRTLIYIGRDYSAKAEYWKLAANRSKMENRLPFELEHSLARAGHDRERLAGGSSLGTNHSVQNRWFVLEHRNGTYEGAAQGPWAESIDPDCVFQLRDGPTPRPAFTSEQLQAIPKSEVDLEREKEEMELEKELEMEADSDMSEKPEIDGDGTFVDATAVPRSTTPPDTESSDSSSESNLDYTYETLLETLDGKPLVFRIQRSDWKKSQVLCVANGQCLLNFGIVAPKHRTLVNTLLQSITPRGKVGLLESDTDATILENKEYQGGLKGFEMLTVWPISLVTMHAITLGIFIMAAMIPIFGRPKELSSDTRGDFGKHIEALGSLLYYSRDEPFALKAISEYFRTVRKDPQSPWATFREGIPAMVATSNDSQATKNETGDPT